MLRQLFKQNKRITIVSTQNSATPRCFLYFAPSFTQNLRCFWVIENLMKLKKPHNHADFGGGGYRTRTYDPLLVRQML